MFRYYENLEGSENIVAILKRSNAKYITDLSLSFIINRGKFSQTSSICKKSKMADIRMF